MVSLDSSPLRSLAIVGIAVAMQPISRPAKMDVKDSAVRMLCDGQI